MLTSGQPPRAGSVTVCAARVSDYWLINDTDVCDNFDTVVCAYGVTDFRADFCAASVNDGTETLIQR